MDKALMEALSRLEHEDYAIRHGTTAREDDIALIRAALAALEPVEGDEHASGGWQLVPLKPTPRMIKAWHDAYGKSVTKTGRSARAYAAMLAAAREVAAQTSIESAPSLAAGMIAAAAIIVSAHGECTIAGTIVNALGKDWWKDGDEYDLDILRPHFREIPAAIEQQGRESNNG